MPVMAQSGPHQAPLPHGHCLPLAILWADGDYDGPWGLVGEAMAYSHWPGPGGLHVPS